MKVNIEIDLTPQEFQELFIPGEKQKEFVKVLAEAYVNAATKAGTDVFNKTTDEILKLLQW